MAACDAQRRSSAFAWDRVRVNNEKEDTYCGRHGSCAKVRASTQCDIPTATKANTGAIARGMGLDAVNLVKFAHGMGQCMTDGGRWRWYGSCSQ